MIVSSHFVFVYFGVLKLLPLYPALCSVVVTTPITAVFFKDGVLDFSPSVSQATDRPMGMNGLDVAGLRPFDLVIPFTIQKGEITGNDCRQIEPWSSLMSSELLVSYC